MCAVHSATSRGTAHGRQLASIWSEPYTCLQEALDAAADALSGAGQLSQTSQPAAGQSGTVFVAAASDGASLIICMLGSSCHSSGTLLDSSCQLTGADLQEEKSGIAAAKQALSRVTSRQGVDDSAAAALREVSLDVCTT